MAVEKVHDARDLTHISRRTASREWYQPKREMYVAHSKARGTEPSKPFRNKIPEVRHGAIAFAVCPAGF